MVVLSICAGMETISKSQCRHEKSPRKGQTYKSNCRETASHPNQFHITNEIIQSIPRQTVLYAFSFYPVRQRLWRLRLRFVDAEPEIPWHQLLLPVHPEPQGSLLRGDALQRQLHVHEPQAEDHA